MYLLGGIRCSITLYALATSLVKPADKAKGWLTVPHLSLLALIKCAMLAP
jgi:hypothetical protein